MKIRHALAASLTCLVALTACGGSDDSETEKRDDSSSSSSKESAESLLADAKKQFTAADQFRIKGEIKEDEETGAIDVSYVGDDAKGSFSLSSQGDFEFVVVDDTPYVKGSKEFWTDSANAEAAAQFAGKWVTSKNFGSLADEFSRESFLDDLLEPEGKVSIGPDKTIDGVDCISLVDTDDDGKSYLYLEEESHRPVQISQGDDNDVDITYDDIAKPTKPSDALDVDALMG